MDTNLENHRIGEIGNFGNHGNTLRAVFPAASPWAHMDGC